MSAFAAELFEPAREDRGGSGFDVQELKAHADSGFDDADHGESFNGFAFARQGNPDTGFDWDRFAGADEAAAEGDIRSDSIGADAGFKIEDFRIGGKRKTDSVAAVAQAYFVRRAIGGSVVHGDNVAHCL